MISFQSLAYYIYALLAFFLINQFREVKYRKFFMLGINILFLALLLYFRKKHFVLLMAFVVGNYAWLIASQKFSKRGLLANIQIGLSLSFLCFFKYEIFQEPILWLMPSLRYFLKPAVFIGISFFTFRLISLVVDLIHDKKKVDFVDFANYLLFFPCFLSGPFDRFERFKNDLDQSAPLDAKQSYEALYRIILGAFKKGIIADGLYSLSSDSYHILDIETLPISKVILSHYIYSFVLYFDFSGYSDIAIGISNLFGVKTPENFNNPYMARNIQDFWNKWHITLMHWLRDYVYFPCQKFMMNLGMRNFVLMACIAYLFTFFIAGVWHGDNLSFTLYGISHGLAFTVYLSYKKALEGRLSREQLLSYQNSKLIKFGAMMITYHYFLFSLFFFIQKPIFFIRLWRVLCN